MVRITMPVFVLFIFFVLPVNCAAQVLGQSEYVGFQYYENKGQIVDQDGNPNSDVKYLFQGAGLNFQLRSNGFSYDVFKQVADEGAGAPPKDENASLSVRNELVQDVKVQVHRVDVSFLGSSSEMTIEGVHPSRDVDHYYTAGCLPEGVTDVHRYQKVLYSNVYPGIDFLFTTVAASDNTPYTKYDIIVRPGGDLRDVRLRYEGAEALSLREDGTLEIRTSVATIEEAIPICYTLDSDGRREPLEGAGFVLNGETIMFDVSEYDSEKTLVIDPLLKWATYYGGNMMDRGYEMVWDSAGDIVFTSRTSSTNNIATSGAHQNWFAGVHDGYIAKFTTSGTRLWGTYYGSAEKDASHGIAIDNNDNLYIVGETESPFGLALGNSHQTSNGGGRDAFIAKFTGGGNLLWATYYGGSFTEEAFSVAVTDDNLLVVVGRTESSNNISTSGAYQTSHGGGGDDAFIAVFDLNGTRQWGSYYGGGRGDKLLSVKAFPGGRFVFAGEAASTTGISTSGAHQNTLGGNYDGLVGMFTTTGTRLWATYYGGAGKELINEVTVGPANEIIISGVTESPDQIATTGVHQQSLSGPRDAYFGRFDASGQLLWGTYYGGSSWDAGFASAISSNKLFVTGETYSVDGIAPKCSDYDTHNGNSDIFIAELTLSGDFVCGMYYGGTLNEIGYDIEFATTDEAIVVGETESSGLATPSSHQPNYNGGMDGILFRMEVACSDGFDIEYDDKSICKSDSVLLDGTELCATPPVTYQWSPAAGLSDPTAAAPFAFPSVTTEYVVTATDANNSVAMDTVTVYVGGPVADAGPDRSICAGSSVIIGGTASGGTPPYTYSWDPPDGLSDPTVAKPIATPATKTTYVVTVTDANGCQDTDTVEVDLSAELEVDAGPDKTLCLETGIMIGLPVTGGTAPYTYTWTPPYGLSDPNIAQPIAKPDVTTTYIVEVVDANGCVGYDTVTVTILPGLNLDLGPDKTICEGGSVQIGTAPTNGTPPFQYQWTPAAGLSNTQIPDPIASPDSTTEYIVTVTDAGGCSATDTIAVIIGDSPVANAGPDVSKCNSGSVTIGAPATGGTPPYQYRWSPQLGLADPNAAVTAVNVTVTTEYIVSVTDANGCTDKDTVLVRIREAPDYDAGPDKSICDGKPVVIGTVPTGFGAPVQISWTPADGLSSTTVPQPTANPARSTTYVVYITGSFGCTAVDSVTVFVDEGLPVNIDRFVTSCDGAPVVIGRAITTGTPPYTYEWQPPAGLDDPSKATPTATPGETRTYVVTVTDANGCVGTDSVTVRYAESPIADAGPDRYICEGDSTTIGRPASGGTPPYTYSWLPLSSLSDPSAVSPIAYPPVTTMYVVRVVDANGCADTDTVFVNVDRMPNPVIEADGPTVFCEGDSVTLDAGDGYVHYEWSTGDTTRTITVKQSGKYTVIVETRGGCVGTSREIEVFVHPALDPKIVGPIVVCPDGTARYTTDPVMDLAYEWEVVGGELLTANTNKQIDVGWKGPGSGLVIVTVRSGSCVGRDTLEVTIREVRKPDIFLDGDPVLCDGSSLMLSIDPGYAAIEWSNGTTGPSTIVTEPGDYTVTVTDSNGCTAVSDIFTVTDGGGASVEITGPAVLCEGAVAELLATDGYPSYYWSTGDTTRTIQIDRPGTYIVFVMNDAGCRASDTLTVTGAPGLKPEITGTLEFCEGAWSGLDAGEGFVRYLWSSGSTEQQTIVHEGGTYWVQVWDENGCTGFDTVQVVERPGVRFDVRIRPVAGEPGDLVRLVVEVANADSLQGIGEVDYLLQIAWTMSVMSPVRVLTPGAEIIENNKERPLRVLQIEGTYRGGDEILLELECILMLADTDIGDAMIQVFLPQIACPSVQFTHGAIDVAVCEEGGKRLVMPDESAFEAYVYPNPFTHATTIAFTIPAGTDVRLSVMDALGREVAVLVNGHRNAGSYTALFDAAGLPSGRYIYLLTAGGESLTGEIILSK